MTKIRETDLMRRFRDESKEKNNNTSSQIVHVCITEE